MIVEIGDPLRVIGRVISSPAGIKYEGEAGTLKALVESMRRGERWAKLSDDDLVKSLPQRLRGRIWAEEVAQ